MAQTLESQLAGDSHTAAALCEKITSISTDEALTIFLGLMAKATTPEGKRAIDFFVNSAAAGMLYAYDCIADKQEKEREAATVKQWLAETSLKIPSGLN